MLLWNAEVQYVCRNAARQSRGIHFAAQAAIAGFSGRSKRRREETT
jgi:hypothetical protein